MTVITIIDEVKGVMQIETDFDRFEKNLTESINFCKINQSKKPIIAKDFNINQGVNFIDKVVKFYREGC